MEKCKMISKEEFIQKVSSHFDALDPVAEIHRELKSLITEGYNRDEIHKMVEGYLTELQEQKKEKEEDIMTDVLTFFIGWSAKDWQL